MTTTPARPICPRPLRLGVTGGIGSGKSTFAAMLRDCGAALIDADAIARAVTEAGGPAIADIRDTFGADYIDAQVVSEQELDYSEPRHVTERTT